MRFLEAVICAMALGMPLSADGVVPRPSPEYAVKLTNGQQVLLSSQRGNVVALLFISTECPHCQKTCEMMERLQAEYGPRGFRTMAVAFNEMSKMLLPEFIKRHRLTFPVGYDTRDPVFTYIERSPMLRTFVPMLVLIDRRGTIRGQYLGDDKLWLNQEQNVRATLEPLLKERPNHKPASSSANGGTAKKKSS
jgi:peroxiredoxin